MLFTVVVVAVALAWLVALGRQALPPHLRVPLVRATTRELARDAGRGLRELDRLHRGRRLLPPTADDAQKPRRASGSTSSRSS